MNFGKEITEIKLLYLNFFWFRLRKWLINDFIQVFMVSQNAPNFDTG